MSYFYIPTSNLNLNNILSTESISPFVFYEKRGFGFKRYEKINSNQFNNTFLAYSALPIIPIIISDREEFPIFIRIPQEYLLGHRKHSIKGKEIYQIDSTIYLRWTKCIIIVSNDDQRKKLIASTGKSLEIKNSTYYLDSICVLNQEFIDTFEWEDSLLNEIYDYNYFNNEKVLYDQKINKLKGLVYGYASGLLREQPKEVIEGKQYFQDFINVFSGLMNDLSLYSSGTNNIKSTKDFDSQFKKLQILKERINILFSFKEQCHINKTILEKFKIDDATLKLLDTYKYKNYSILDIIRHFIKEQDKNLNTINDLIDLLITQGKEFIRFGSQISYNKLVGDFNLIIDLVNDKISHYQHSEIVKNKLENIPFQLNNNNEIEYTNPNISLEEKIGFNIIANDLLNRFEMSSSDDIAQGRKDIIVGIANKIKELYNVQDNNELTYLRRLHKSLTTVGVGFKINEIESLTFQSIAVFLSRYADVSKFQDYLEKNKISKLGLAYAFWGTAYGYANLSKIFLSPLQSNLNTLQIIINYFLELEGNNNLTIKSTNPPDKNLTPESRIVEWEINKRTSSCEEPVSLYQSMQSFKDFIKNSDKLNKDQNWIKEIELCSKIITNQILPNDPTFKKSYVSEFHLLLSKRSKHLKNFGKAKITEATKLFEQFINMYE